MMWEILPDMAWKSAVTLGLTLALLHLLKQRSAAQRAWVAHIGLIATLLLPLAAMLLPRWKDRARRPTAPPDCSPALHRYSALSACPAVRAPSSAPFHPWHRGRWRGRR